MTVSEGHLRGPSGSRGGQANEAGSLFRSGVAAYLAVHGLVGRGVEAAGYPATGPAPTLRDPRRPQWRGTVPRTVAYVHAVLRKAFRDAVVVEQLLP